MNARRTVIPMSDDSHSITREDVESCSLPDAFTRSEIAVAALAFKLPSYDEIPSIGLYRDQVISFVDDVFSPIQPWSEGPWLTPSMVNNYVKAGIVPAPIKKKYGREQVSKLIVICLLKQVLPISAIKRLMRMQELNYPVGEAYDYIATEFMNAIRNAFANVGRQPEDTATTTTLETFLVRNAASAFASRALLYASLEFSGYKE